MAKSAGKTQTLYLDAPLNVDLPATEENPGGRMVRLNAGYNEVDDPVLLSHPIVHRMIHGDQSSDYSEADADYNQAVAEAGRERDEAIAKAHGEYHEAVTKAAEARDKARGRAVEDYGKRRDDAINRNVVFSEPHPDPETRRAQALTASPSQVYPSATFAQKPLSAEERDKAEEHLPSESDVAKRQQHDRAHLHTKKD